MKKFNHKSTYRNCAWLISTLVLLHAVLLILSFKRHPSPPCSPQLHQFTRQSKHHKNDCKFGTVYVYDLPPLLNKDLVNICNESASHWIYHCNSLSNGGFGSPGSTVVKGLMPENLVPAWYQTDIFATEVMYHNRMLSHKCRTMNPDEATAFYIPYYAGLTILKYLFVNHTAKEIDSPSVAMLNFVTSQGPWKRTNGSDHFITLGRLTWDFRRNPARESDHEWGTSLLYMPYMKNVLHLGPERSPWHDLEISVPYPNAFHPRSKSDIRQWQRFVLAKRRNSLFSYVGGTRKHVERDFKGLLSAYCKNESESCRLVDCSVLDCYRGSREVLQGLLESDFCLQPKGDGFTRKGTFDCMLGGSIPVFFWNKSFENQYEWHLPAVVEDYSVFIHRDKVREDASVIRRMLEKYSREKVEEMRKRIVGFMPNILVAQSNADLGNVRDAFDISLDGVLRRFKQQKSGLNLPN